MKKILSILAVLLFIIHIGNVHAQNKLEFSASAPDVVYVGTPFQLVYSINASAKDLKSPDFQYFEILAGPFESRSSYMQTINGKSSSSTNLSYTYTLMPNKVGTFKIPPASIVVNGEKKYSNGLTIKVEPESKAPKGQGQSGRIQTEESSKGNLQKVTGESIFIRTIVSKTNIYEQEAITVTYKLYTLLDVAQFTGFKLPDFNGFLKQEIEQSQNKQLSYENYNGKNYGTLVLYQIILFPQHTGTISIDKANFTALLRLQNKSQVQSIFDDFFDSYTNVEKTLTAPGATITVNELPTSGKPASFSGAVGNFRMISTISSDNLKTNEAATLKLTISGVGNMKLLKNPVIKFPDGFEVYDPKVDNQFSTGSNGVSGTKTIEYTFIPRRTGQYVIPGAELSYFDLNDKTYKTLKTTAYSVNISKGSGNEAVVSNFTNKEEVTQLAKDIRYIYTDNIKLKSETRPWFGTLPFWMMFLLPLVIAAIVFIFLRKQIKENANIALVKTKRANKVAQKRLKIAQKYLSEDNKEQFYQEVMKAVWTYLSDKLSIPVSSLNKENIHAKMAASGMDENLIEEFKNILDTCEFASYAPNSGLQEMGNIYEVTANAIGKVEEHFRRK